MSVLNYSTLVNVIFHHCLIYIMEGWAGRKRGMKWVQSNEATFLQRHLTDEFGRQGGNTASWFTCSHTCSRMLSSNFEMSPPSYFSVRSVALTEEELDPRCSIWWPVLPLEATSGGIGFNLERPLPSFSSGNKYFWNHCFTNIVNTYTASAITSMSNTTTILPTL